MMYQCQVCHRFLPSSCEKCNYCDSKSLNPYFGQFDILDDYQTSITKFPIEGEIYNFESCIGRGGSGSIFKVSDSSGNLFALKVALHFDKNFSNHKGMQTKQLSDAVGMMNNEIRRLREQKGDLDYLAVYHTGEMTLSSGKEPVKIQFILMELAISTLDRIIHSEAVGDLIIPYEEKKVMMLDILSSLNRLYKKYNLVHRDISASNIFVVERENQIHYLIGDLGTAKNLSNITTHSTRIIAKRQYMDPLRLSNENYRYDPRLDMFSIGIHLSEIILGNLFDNICLWLYDEDPPLTAFFPYILKPRKKILSPKIYRILKKSTTPFLRFRFNSHKRFLNTLKKFLNSHESFFKPNFNKFKQIDLLLFFLIDLPFKAEKQDNPSEIHFDGRHKISLGNFSDHLLIFNNFKIESASISRTKLFSISKITDNSLLLRAQHNLFQSLSKSKKYSNLISTAEGSLSFFGKLRVNLLP